MTKTNTDYDGSASAVHLSLQGKGGVGKSLVASLLAQYFLSRGQPVRCIDTDPVNQTLSQYRGLTVEHIKLLREGGVDQRGFDVATVTTAVPLTDDQFARLEQRLGAQAGRRVRFDAIVDPSVLGGVRVQIGDDVIDGSVATRLNDLRQKLAG